MLQSLVNVKQVDDVLAALALTLDIVRLPLDHTEGRILAEPLHAREPGPPYDRATMDGYALRKEDSAAGIVDFRVVGRQWPGVPPLMLPVEPGSCVEIMTGAPCPGGADCVVPYEDTLADGNLIHLREGVDLRSFQCLHRMGSDYAAGDLMLEAGCRLGAPEIGIAASVGAGEVVVRRLPKLALVSTGDELVPYTETPSPYQIRSSNQPALAAALRLAGFGEPELRHIPDDRAQVEAAFRELLLTSQVVIVTGGVSKGRKDWVGQVLAEMAEPIFHGVTQRPGKPMGCWRAREGGAVVFGLPGNPVSALTGLHRHVLPWLQGASGYHPVPAPRRAALGRDVRDLAPRGFTWFLPVRLGLDGQATPRLTNTSGDFAALHGSDGFLELPPEYAESEPARDMTYVYTPWLR